MTAAMTAAEYRAALDALGLSQARLGRLFGVDKNTPNRWAMGAVAVPGAVALILRAMLAGLLTIEALEAL